MTTGRTPQGKRPIIEKSEQVYSNILDTSTQDREPKFPMREAYEKAQTEVSHVLIPTSGTLTASGEAGPHMDPSTAQPPIPPTAQPHDNRDTGNPIPTPLTRGEAATPDPEDNDDDVGPGGIQLDAPLDVDGRDHQLEDQPDEDARLGLAMVEYCLHRQSCFSEAKPKCKVPHMGQLLARTTQNLSSPNLDYFEDRRCVVGLSRAELTEPLPLTGRRKTCSIRVVLFYDPDYEPITRVHLSDPEYGDHWLRKIANSTNPGIHPDRWFKMSHPLRREAVEQYKA